MPDKLPPLSQEDYKETKKMYADYRLNQSNLLDKNILVISASSLGAMIAFSEKIRPLSEANYLSFFIASIVFFGFATAFTLTSLYTAYLAVCSFDEQLNKNQQAGFYCTPTNKWDRCTGPLNILSYLAFIIGLICALSYISINIYERGNNPMAEQKSITTVLPTVGSDFITEGATIPQPHVSTPHPGQQTPQPPQQPPHPQQKK